MASTLSQEPLAVSVRTASSDDVDDLIPLYAGFMLHEGIQPPDAGELRRRLARLLDSKTDDVLIARDRAGRALGYLQQRYYLSVWRPDRDAYIEDVFVVESSRGRGVGEALVRAGLQRAREHGAARICLDTNERNLRARQLYERLGFDNHHRNGGSQLFYSRLL